MKISAAHYSTELCGDCEHRKPDAYCPETERFMPADIPACHLFRMSLAGEIFGLVTGMNQVIAEQYRGQS